MSDSLSNEPAPVDNPFQTPRMEATQEDHPASPVAPSMTTLAICVALAWGVKLLTYDFTWLTEGEGLEFNFLTWVLYDAISGPVVGLGLALLTTACWRGKFKQLLPGHWQLIAFSAMLFFDIAYALSIHFDTLGDEMPFDWLYWFEMSAPYFFDAILFGLFLQIKETWPWKIYAWLGLLYYVVSVLDGSISFLVISDVGSYTLSTDWVIGMHIAWFLLWLTSAMAFVVAVMVDLARGTRRDAFHYVGLFLPSVVTLWHNYLTESWFPY